MPNPPRTAAGVATTGARSGAYIDEKTPRVEATSATPAHQCSDRLLKNAPSLFEAKAHANRVTIMAMSNTLWPAYCAVGNSTNDPTNTTSIQARYTPSPRKNNGMWGSRSISPPRASAGPSSATSCLSALCSVTIPSRRSTPQPSPRRCHCIGKRCANQPSAAYKSHRFSCFTCSS